MKIQRANASHERSILIGMITNRAVVGAIASKWVEGMFSSRFANLIASWCVSYFKKFKKSPGRNIQSIFDEWANEAKRDKETIQLVERFLSSLSSEYANLKEAVNPDYTIDLAGNYFTKVNLKKLADEITAALDDGDITAADTLVKKYGGVQIGGDAGVDVLHDMEVVKRAFDSKKEPLITYPHGLGIFYGDALERDGFIAFMGPEKRGKTFILLDIAWNAMLQNRKVAFFEVGDLSQNQIMRRFMVRAAGIPILRKPKVVNYPTAIVCGDEGEAEIDYEIKKFKTGLDFVTAKKACRFITKEDKSKSLLKLFTYPNSSISIYGVQSVLDTLERNNWIPDIVVIDYADILANPIAGATDSREQINATWKAMRAMSQSLHCLVVTATQAKAAAYSVDTMGQEHFSEDKRKHAHVTGMVGLNQTNAEKQRGIIRLNWIDLREEEFVSSQCCHVGQCLSLGNPCVVSVMGV